MKELSLLDPGFRTLTRISLPIMYSFLSILGMLFADRMFVNWYSVDALTAITSSGTLSWAAVFFAMQTGVCSEVFVAQYNGGGKQAELGRPVWQLVWFSLFLIPIYTFLAIAGSKWVFSGPQYTQDHRIYFSIMMAMGPISGINSALGGFFIGQGKVKIVQNLTILGNLVNILLDPIMINGVKGICPEMGVFGAGLATVIGGLVTTGGFFYFILNPENREKGAFDWVLRPKLFLKCLKIGVPSGTFQLIDMGAWGLFYLMMDMTSQNHILVAGVCQSILILFLFPALGLEKGIMTISGNLLGAGQLSRLSELIRSSFKWVLMLAFWYMVPLALFPSPFLKIFSIGNEAVFAPLEGTFHRALFILALHLVLESVKFVYKALLMSAGDTFFLLVFGSFGVWAFMVIPTYYGLFHLGLNIDQVMWVVVFYSFVQLSIYYFRFRQMIGKGRVTTLMQAD